MPVTLMFTHTHTHKVIKKIERNKNKASPMIPKENRNSLSLCARKKNGKNGEHECDMDVGKMRKYENTGM